MQPPSILGFFGPFRFLSNFHFVEVKLDGETYRTTEHAYQAAKTLDLQSRKLIQSLPQPRDARRAGQEVVYRPDWDEIKLDVMFDLNAQKFVQQPLERWLLDTGDMYLEETNTWGDVFWGVCGGKGENHLGKILMSIRSGLKDINKSPN